MNAKPLVSVICTTRNEAAILWRSILTVLAQSMEEWELIVVNRGSTDSTEELLREFGDPRIRVVHTVEMSSSAARILGLRHAQGEYVAYLTADTGWESDFLREMLSRAAGDVHGLLWHCGETVYEYETLADGRPMLANVSVRCEAPTLDDALAMQGPGAHTWLHRRELFDLVGGWDPECLCYEDEDLFLRIMSAYPHCIRTVDLPLAERRAPFVSETQETPRPRSVREMYRRAAGRRYLRDKWRDLPAVRTKRVEWN